MFHIGDRVCYPMHGVGIIQAIEEHQVLGKCAQYYILRFLDGKMMAMVPVEKAAAIGLRQLISAEESEKVLLYLDSAAPPVSETWNQRYRENMDKLRSGEIYGVADVVKTLSQREREHGLSSGEHRMLATAKTMLLAELCAASGRGREQINAIIRG